MGNASERMGSVPVFGLGSGLGYSRNLSLIRRTGVLAKIGVADPRNHGSLLRTWLSLSVLSLRAPRMWELSPDFSRFSGPLEITGGPKLAENRGEGPRHA